METEKEKLVLTFGEAKEHQFGLVGGKGINLARMTQFGLPVPPGFMVTTAAFRQLFGVNSEAAGLIREILGELDYTDTPVLERVGAQIRDIVMLMRIPTAMMEAIHQAYRDLGRGLVAVRSSATAEDLPDASFAGQQLTLLNITGEDELVDAVLQCIASLYTDRAIAYRAQNGIDHTNVEMAVVVQRMVQSEVAGVMMTIDPQTSAAVVVIEAAYGLGEFVVGGNVTPDSFTLERETLRIIRHLVATQHVMLVRSGFGIGNEEVTVPAELQDSPKLDNEQAIELARIGLLVEKFYGGTPQDIEWAMYGGEFYLVQSRPITTIHRIVTEEPAPAETAQLLAVGQGASSGVVAGRVIILEGPHQNDLVAIGDILVTRMTTPDFVPAMQKAAAIVTEQGGRTCHAAIVSRELGKVCIVGVANALGLPVGEIITVDGSHGKVYGGVAQATLDWYTRLQVQLEQEAASMANVKTITKLGVILADAAVAQQVALQNVDMVGLLRIELVLANIAKHPRQFIAEGQGHVFVDLLAAALEQFCCAFAGRPVIVRFTDFKTNEYSNLAGAMAYEPLERLELRGGGSRIISKEENPMMGIRGALRYLIDSESFALEIEAIKRVRERHLNLSVMVPFVRTPAEIRGVIDLMAELGLRRDGLEVGMMVEVPSNVILLEEFIRAGELDFVSIGSNDLTQLTLGADRDNPEISARYDERDPAVMWLIKRTIEVAHAHGVRVGICGQAPSDWPDITRFLVGLGIDSISVTPDRISQTRRIIHDVENTL